MVNPVVRFHYLLLLPIWGFYANCQDFEPGTGPQGGKAIFLLSVLYGLVVVGMAAINGIFVMAKSKLIWWQRFLAWPASLLCLSVAAVFVGFAMLDAATDPNFTSNGKASIAIALPALILVFLRRELLGTCSNTLMVFAKPERQPQDLRCERGGPWTRTRPMERSGVVGSDRTRRASP